jgi:transcription antitermination protein NusB
MSETRAPAGVRRKAREFAFRVLFESEQGGSDLNHAWENARADIATPDEGKSREDEGNTDALDAEALAFAHRLVLGYDEKRYDVDQTLERVIEGWTFGQMSKTDLAMLKLASYEMMFLDTPHAPVIEVAVRIAKKFGGEESGKFVNGVLAKLKRQLETVA